MASRRRRKISGFIPWLARAAWGSVCWLWRHPQPLAVAVILSAALSAVWLTAQRADAFRITDVRLPPQSTLKLPDHLIGRNVWSVDIYLLGEELKRQQPWLREVRVIRELPSSLRVEAIERAPVAQVHVDRWYPVDREGFVLPAGQAEPSEQLIRIAGAHSANTPVKAGVLNTGEPLQLALRVLARAKRHRALATRKLSAIDVSDPAQITFFLQEETEIRCGSEVELESNLERLRQALQTMSRQSMAAKYIDVRFPDPVVSPQT